MVASAARSEVQGRFHDFWSVCGFERMSAAAVRKFKVDYQTAIDKQPIYGSVSLVEARAAFAGFPVGTPVVDRRDADAPTLGTLASFDAASCVVATPDGGERKVTGLDLFNLRPLGTNTCGICSSSNIRDDELIPASCCGNSICVTCIFDMQRNSGDECCFCRAQWRLFA